MAFTLRSSDFWLSFFKAAKALKLVSPTATFSVLSLGSLSNVFEYHFHHSAKMHLPQNLCFFYGFLEEEKNPLFPPLSVCLSHKLKKNYF